MTRGHWAESVMELEKNAACSEEKLKIISGMAFGGREEKRVGRALGLG